MSWSTSFQTARILLFLSRPQVQTARCGTRQSTIWQQITRSVSAISGLILYQQVPAQLHQTMRRQGMRRQTPAMRMPYSRIMRNSLPLQPHREHMLQVRLQVAMCMSAMQQAHPALPRLSHSTGTIRLT